MKYQSVTSAENEINNAIDRVLKNSNESSVIIPPSQTDRL
jgi:hypothetical protein